LFSIVYNSKMSNSAAFTEAADKVKTFTQKPTDQELLELYALFKQATVGDVNIDRPGMFDLKGKAKWDAWNALKGLNKGDAETQYIQKVSDLSASYK